MVEFDEIKQSLTNMKPKINSLSEAVNVEELKGKIKNQISIMFKRSNQYL